MAVIDRDGFKFLNGTDNYIVVEGSKLDDCIDYINEKKITAVYLMNPYYTLDNVDFFSKCNLIEKVNLSSSYITDYSGFTYLNNLKTLRLQEPKGKMSLSIFPKLEVLLLDLDKNITEFNRCSLLNHISFWKYKPNTGDLGEFSQLSYLRELTLIQSVITTLKGCENLKALSRLELNSISKLSNIDDLRKNSATLKELKIESCKNIKSFEVIKELKSLERLSIINCGEIPSLDFVPHLPNLRFLVFLKTNVVDGNLSYCEGIEYVGFDNKKHYTHKMSDFVDVKRLYGSTTTVIEKN
ncbi:hypothetical protein ACP26L_28300 [Paenibacillus sp. S-38]|uniref:hypothetical protein n=1 Tax=Paenibacillus sp. S-38 TaxID=3416710 RepID=UPI003CFA726E